MPATLVLANGNFFCFDPSRPRARAVAFDNGRVIGWDDDALAQRGCRTEVIDLRGLTVIPGLVDAHVHFTGYALSLTRVNLEGAHSLSEAVARVEERVKTTAPGEWIHGHTWNHNDWDVKVFPTKEPLDAIAPGNPIALMRKDGHSMWVNSAALRAMNITRETPDPDGGKIERDAQGEPNGILREQAMKLIGTSTGVAKEKIPRVILKRAIAEAHRVGLVGVHNIEGAPALRAFQDLHTRGELTLRVTQFFPITQIESAVALGLEQGFGDEWLRIAGVKVFSDGALGSQTAWMLEPFEGTGSCGMPITPREEIERIARLAAESNFQVAVHAIGDRANRTVLDVYDKLRGEGFSDAVFRIEHAQHLTREDIPRFAKLNVTASMQPIHQPSDMFVADRLIGQRARWSYAFRSLLDAGATLIFGSDCPVETLAPLEGIHAAVTRQNERGQPLNGWYPQEKISVNEAVRAFLGLGSPPSPLLSPGKRQTVDGLTRGGRADWVVLSQNIFEVPAREILNTLVEYTVAGGRVVHTS